MPPVDLSSSKLLMGPKEVHVASSHYGAADICQAIL